MAKDSGKLTRLYNILAGVDKTYHALPLTMRLAIQKISQGLSEFGPRRLHRAGPGTEFYEAREYQEGVDEVRSISARLSARADKLIVVDREAEIRQHIYLWRDGTPSMDYSSKPGALFTKREAAEVMLLSFAKHLARNEEMVGILDREGTYRGGNASDILAQKLYDVQIIASTEMPVIARKLPRNSTAVLFSDFFMDRETLIKGLSHITGTGLKGYLVMVLDPQEIDFTFKGHTQFEGLEGEGSRKFTKAEAIQAAYQEKMREHIADVKSICEAKGFKFIIQRTDEPLSQGLLSIYGLKPKSPPGAPAPSL